VEDAERFDDKVKAADRFGSLVGFRRMAPLPAGGLTLAATDVKNDSSRLRDSNAIGEANPYAGKP
jgi:hypothetical protein